MNTKIATPKKPVRLTWQGAVVGIHVAPFATAPMGAVDNVRAISGKGLEGDRYCEQTGTYSDKPGPAREVTLIESEALEGMRREYGIELDAGRSRRNIVTRDV